MSERVSDERLAQIATIGPHLLSNEREVGDVVDDLRDARARLAAAEAACGDVENALASTWSCGHARFPVALESHPECVVCEKARCARLLGLGQRMRAAFERILDGEQGIVPMSALEEWDAAIAADGKEKS
jgi:hypothetical protein